MGEKYVLVVDDMIYNFKLLEAIFKSFGIVSYWSENGYKAIEMVLAKPEIMMVIMDIKMPEMDGITATGKIKEIAPDLPVIMYSAIEDTTTIEKSYEAGCTDFLSKPLNIKKLIQIINRFT